MAGEHNIITVEGDTWLFNFTVDTDGTPWNLATYTARMQVRQSTIATTTLLDISTSDYISMNSSGDVSIEVPSSVMADINDGRYVYDFELTSGGGQKTTLLQGSFIVSPQVTD